MKNIRVGKITIGGQNYPAVINTKLLMQLEDEGNSIDNLLEAGPRRWHNFVHLIALAINEGYKRQCIGKDDVPSVTEDDVADSIDIADISEAGQVMTDIAVLLGRSRRTVEAIPPKN